MISKTSEKSPDLAFTFTLESHVQKKVIAVALAAIAFFGIQFGLSWIVTLSITSLCSTITILSEKFLRTDSNQKNDWFNWDKKNTTTILSKVFLRIAFIFTMVFLITISGILPFQAVGSLIMSGNLRIIFLATVVAPIAEEILFRGFIQERFQDIFHLFSRHVFPLSSSKVDLLSVLSSGLCFGSVHIIGQQVTHIAKKIYVLFGTTLFGIIASLYKDSYQSLIAPIGVHCAQNTGFTLGLLAAARKIS